MNESDRRVAWGSDEYVRSINVLWRKILCFLLRYPLDKHLEVQSEFYRYIRALCIYE